MENGCPFATITTWPWSSLLPSTVVKIQSAERAPFLMGVFTRTTSHPLFSRLSRCQFGPESDLPENGT